MYDSDRAVSRLHSYLLYWLIDKLCVLFITMAGCLHI